MSVGGHVIKKTFAVFGVLLGLLGVACGGGSSSPTSPTVAQPKSSTTVTASTTAAIQYQTVKLTASSTTGVTKFAWAVPDNMEVTETTDNTVTVRPMISGGPQTVTATPQLSNAEPGSISLVVATSIPVVSIGQFGITPFNPAAPDAVLKAIPAQDNATELLVLANVSQVGSEVELALFDTNQRGQQKLASTGNVTVDDQGKVRARLPLNGKPCYLYLINKSPYTISGSGAEAHALR